MARAIKIPDLKKQLDKAKEKIKTLEASLKPCNNKVQSLLETAIIISSEISSKEGVYETLYEEIGQGMFGPWSWFTELAHEFEETYKDREWGMDDGEDYIDVLDNFINDKLKKKLGYTKLPKKIPNGKTKVQKRGANGKKVR
jgi:hypothetical protein